MDALFNITDQLCGILVFLFVVLVIARMIMGQPELSHSAFNIAKMKMIIDLNQAEKSGIDSGWVRERVEEVCSLRQPDDFRSMLTLRKRRKLI